MVVQKCSNWRITMNRPTVIELHRATGLSFTTCNKWRCGVRVSEQTNQQLYAVTDWRPVLGEAPAVQAPLGRPCHAHTLDARAALVSPNIARNWRDGLHVHPTYLAALETARARRLYPELILPPEGTVHDWAQFGALALHLKLTSIGYAYWRLWRGVCFVCQLCGVREVPAPHTWVSLLQHVHAQGTFGHDALSAAEWAWVLVQPAPINP